MKRARDEAIDLRVPFGLITASWYKSNKAIFALKGPGKYADLKDSTKKQKKARFGHVYPILRASGVLEKSITQPGAQYGIAKQGKQELTLGSSVPYGGYLQSGTKFMPSRPFVLLGAEQVAPSGINNRDRVWVRMITDYVSQKTQAAFK
jgi:phage gpG-like protein